MTIKEFLDRAPNAKSADGTPLKDRLAETVSIWDNNSAKGYALRAARYAELTEDQTAALLRCLSLAFDDMTVEEAAAEYQNSPAAGDPDGEGPSPSFRKVDPDALRGFVTYAAKLANAEGASEDHAASVTNSALMQICNKLPEAAWMFTESEAKAWYKAQQD